MKSLIFLLVFVCQQSSFAQTCRGRFTPFEMLKVGVDNPWITLKGVTEERECESVYGKITCSDWRVNDLLKPFISKLTLKLVSQGTSVFAKGTHYKDTRGYFTWNENTTTMDLYLKRQITVRGECRQWGAPGGVGYGGCRSWGTATRTIDMGKFEGRVNESCAYLIGPIKKSDPIYFSSDTFAYSEKRQILK